MVYDLFPFTWSKEQIWLYLIVTINFNINNNIPSAIVSRQLQWNLSKQVHKGLQHKGYITLL